MPKTESIADQNAVEVPLYTSLDVVRYLHLPGWVALPLSGQGTDWLFHPFMHFPAWRASLPDDFGVAIHEDQPRRLSFHTLADVFVHSSIFRIIPTQDQLKHWRRKDHGFLAEPLWEAFRRIESDRSLFSNPDPERIASRLDRPSHFFGWNLEKTAKLIALHLDRVEIRDGKPIRLYPFSRDAAPDAPRTVMIDPEIRFGRPAVKGVPTDVLVERWRGGDNLAELADDYGLTTDEVDEALRYEATAYLTPFLFPFLPFGW